MPFTCSVCAQCAHFGDCSYEHTCADSSKRCESCAFDCEQFEVDDPSYWDED